jgi:hypothetical protein
MRVVWTLLKVVIGLAIAIPVAVIVLGIAGALLGTLFGLAVLALKLVVGLLVVVGLFKLGTRLFRGPVKTTQPPVIRDLPRPDPHYEAAMRELDQELRQSR